MTATSRVEHLQEMHGFSQLVPLDMPEGSPGSRPWAYCYLARHFEPEEWVPIDVSCAVRVTTAIDLPAWADSVYASLKNAIRVERSDFRLSRSDLARLKAEFAGDRP
jgi:hypothetical protein